MTAAVNPFELATPPAEAAQPAATAPSSAPAPESASEAQSTASPSSYGGEDPFDGPAPQSDRPKVVDMYGRLLLIIPHKLEEGLVNRFDPKKTQDRLTADVIVLDGGPLAYGGDLSETPPVPHDKTAEVPYKVERMFLPQAGLISQCRKALKKRLAGEPGMVLGRLGKGEKKGDNKAPWLLAEPTEQDKNIARQYLSTVDPFA